MPIREKTILQAVKHYQNKKAFLFDMDGLIFDTERLFMEQLAVVMKEQGYELTREIYAETLGTCGSFLQELMQSHYGSQYPFQEISQEADRRVRMVADTVGLTVKTGIPEVLSYLADRSVPCVVASSTRSDKVAFYLEKAGIAHYFRDIVGGEMAERSKPEPDIFLLASQKAGESPQDCVVLEDSENGVRAALAAGCDVICVPDLKVPLQQVLQQVQAVVMP